ncbi:SBBP repeat-containing protein [Hymenobacter sp. M29]|uniref:SBBP repeat-containing protein n=1 Tax=Hymenobacter mellowenesis TaxID=3063995 RepID=A0ABT9AI77_9BACT|nr:SBBP repeat-containing protein [Hymenobacter sp. M29]MDO7848661.1 SBBP repeat-containing protein [Hymenobacter sp. M29]
MLLLLRFFRPESHYLGLLVWLLILTLQPAAAQAPAFGQAMVVGTCQSGSRSEVTSTALDSFGYAYVTGTFAGTVSFGTFTLTSTQTTDQDVFVAKLDGAGNYLWVAQAGGGQQDMGGGVAVDANGAVYVTGAFYSSAATFGAFTLNATYSGYPAVVNADIFVARLDASGQWLWASRAGGTGSEGANQLAIDQAGDVYITGGFGGATTTFGTTTLNNSPNNAGVYELFVAKIDAQGTWQWARSGGGGGQDVGFDIAVDGANNVYITGLVQSTLGQFGPFALPANTYSADDVLVAKLDAGGTWLWAVRAGSLSIDEAYGIAVDAVGNAYVTGRFSGATATFGAITLTNGGPMYGYGGTDELFVAKLSPAGVWQWAVRGGGDSNEAGRGIALDGTGRLQVVGSFSSAVARLGPFSLPNTSTGTLYSNQMLYPTDAFLAYLSTGGAWLGAVGSQGLGDEYAAAIAADATGNASIVGNFKSAIATFGSTALAGNTVLPTGYATLVPNTAPLLRVSSLAPSSGAPGQTVTLTGSGFVSVAAVLFNGTPAASFAVQSSTRLTAVVPAGVTAGPVSVRTAAGTGLSGTAFQPTVLATAAPAATTFETWPNPVHPDESLQLRLPKSVAPTAITRLELRNALGQTVRAEQFSGSTVRVSVRGLAPGVYSLMLSPTGHPMLRGRVLLAE